MTNGRRGSWTAVGGLVALTVASAAWSVSTAPKVATRYATAASRSTASVPTLSSPSTTALLPSPTGSPATISTTTVPPVPRACPPGCQYPSNYDAITALASSATLVAIVTAHDVRESGSVADFTTDMILQGDANDNVYPIQVSDFSVAIGQGNLVDGMTYLIFMSFVRGGGCVSSLFSYNSTFQVATFVEQSASPQQNEILLSGLVLPIPETITLAEVQARMYPTGGVVYADGTAEWFCPGP